MKTKMNLNGTTRKALVAAITELTGEKPIYRAMPTCNYDIGDITVTKDGSIVFPDESDILTGLAAAGFFPVEAETETAAETEEPTGLTVSLPEDGFTEASLENLRKLVEAKAGLITKALGTDRLDVTVADGKVSFPWWDRMPEPEEAQAYMSFLAALCAMAKEAKRVLAKEVEVESEKYAFRCFLLRLASSAMTARQRGRFCSATFPATPLSATRPRRRSSGPTRRPSAMLPRRSGWRLRQRKR